MFANVDVYLCGFRYACYIFVLIMLCLLMLDQWLPLTTSDNTLSLSPNHGPLSGCRTEAIEHLEI